MQREQIDEQRHVGTDPVLRLACASILGEAVDGRGLALERSREIVEAVLDLGGCVILGHGNR